MAKPKEFPRNSAGPRLPRPLAIFLQASADLQNSTKRWVLVVCSVLVLSGLALPNSATAEPPQNSPILGDSLRKTSITLSVEDQTVEEVLRQLLRSVNMGAMGGAREEGALDARGPSSWTLWLDRRIDPSQKVNLSAAGLPASQVILKTLEPLNLAAYPLPGVLLVGRPEWVSQTLAHLPKEASPVDAGATQAGRGNAGAVGIGAAELRADSVTIEWPVGTTAAEVLSLVVAGGSVDSEQPKPVGWLPHDVWRAGRFTDVDRTLATALVLAQFDLQLERKLSLQSLLTQTEGLPPNVSKWASGSKATVFTQAYPTGDTATIVRECLAEKKAGSSVRVNRMGLLVRTSALNHIDAVAAMWNVKPAAAEPNAGNQADPVFDLKLVNKAVATVLAQLSGAAGKKLRIEPAADLASQRLVTLDASQKTLRQLAGMVAAEVGLTVQWDDGEVVVRKPSAP
ncbi:hypothetical protein [Neorhodopirellula lusitana]|uniref:hypothetical protein n=1 Tax=Neorhodopirellula lusitana TaxID=445327 RepID=UPI003850F7F8